MVGNIARVVGIIFFALFTAVSSWPESSLIPLKSSWVSLGSFIIFCVLVGWQMVVQQLRISKLENARPNIVLKSIDQAFRGNVVTRKIDSLGQLVGGIEHPHFTRIWVANTPIKPVQSVDAIKLYGEITFYNNTGKELFVMGGRWADKDEIADGGKQIEINQLDLSPNSMPVCFDIGLKYHDEDDFYGYNNETPRKNTYGFRDADRRLGKGNYYVGVRFRCKGVDKVFWFQLTNSGAGQDVSLVETVEPSCLNG